MEDFLKLENICKTYSFGDSKVEALQNVNLDVCKGEFLCIIGASGSGKSTLMNILGCLDVPDSGRYTFEDKDILSMSAKEIDRIRNTKIGFIFQGFNLIKSLNALENVELPLFYRGIKKKQRRELSLEALERVGLKDRISHLPGQMSGGQQQRVAIARAIAARPPLILADEPTGNLDKKAGSDIMDILLDLNREGKNIILITHDPNIALMASRTVSVCDGKLSEN